MGDSLLANTQALAEALRRRRWQMCTAESCTGGLIAAQCTALSGSSDWFDSGIVTYSNAAKTTLLGVPASLIQAHGAVSEAVARAMVQGAGARRSCQAAVAVTGIAGPTGGSAAKPVGTVYFAWQVADAVYCEHRVFIGSREEVRTQTVHRALTGLLNRLEDAAQRSQIGV